MARRILWIVLAVCALLFVGCSVSVIRPPSASAFMEKKEDKGIVNISGSFFWGDLIGDEGKFVYKRKGAKTVEQSEDWHEEGWGYRDDEWFWNLSFSFQRNKGYFKYGAGFDFSTPFVQIGFVSDYLGVMGWSNLCLWEFEKIEHKYFQWGGGISLIEQLPVGNNFRVGLTQHLSRNGRESNTVKSGAMWVSTGNHSAPVFYDEIGGGGYVSFAPNDSLRIGIEFRYGRDLTYKRFDRSNDDEKSSAVNRYTVNLSLVSW